MGYGRDDCGLCRGTGHIVEMHTVVGLEIVVEIRPFDPDMEQRPDEGEVWVCPDCFWAEGDPLGARKPHFHVSEGTIASSVLGPVEPTGRG